MSVRMWSLLVHKVGLFTFFGMFVGEDMEPRLVAN